MTEWKCCKNGDTCPGAVMHKIWLGFCSIMTVTSFK